MTRCLHFISGLPRSGSTLLAAILKQNPRYYTGIQSPLADLFGAALRVMSIHESEIFVSDGQRRNVLAGILRDFYLDVTDKEVVFDSNRVWCALLPPLREVAPSARVVCCVRNPAWIIDSMERLIQRNALRVPRMFGDNQGTVFNRVEGMMKGMLGSSLSAFKQAWYSESAHKLIVVRYESLVAKPARSLRTLYETLGQQPFEHDFQHVDHDEPEFDGRLGIPGLHRVSGPVRQNPRETILPPEIFKQHDQEFWLGIGNNPRQVVVI